MKPASAILIGLASALTGYFIWALHKRTKELVYGFVKALFVPIILVLVVFAYGETAGWGWLEKVGWAIGYTVAGIIGAIVIMIVGGVILINLRERWEMRAAFVEKEEGEKERPSEVSHG